MYPLIWRLLPGPKPVKIIEAIILVAALVYVCMEYVFPLVAPHMPFNDGTVGQGEHP